MLNTLSDNYAYKYAYKEGRSILYCGESGRRYHSTAGTDKAYQADQARLKLLQADINNDIDIFGSNAIIEAENVLLDVEGYKADMMNKGIGIGIGEKKGERERKREGELTTV